MSLSVKFIQLTILKCSIQQNIIRYIFLNTYEVFALIFQICTRNLNFRKLNNAINKYIFFHYYRILLYLKIKMSWKYLAIWKLNNILLYNLGQSCILRGYENYFELKEIRIQYQNLWVIINSVPKGNL